MMKTFRIACDPWGITVERVEVSTYIFQIDVYIVLRLDDRDMERCKLRNYLFQVKNLSVARDMVKSLAVEAQASREANGLLIMQKGEGQSLEKIK